MHGTTHLESIHPLVELKSHEQYDEVVLQRPGVGVHLTEQSQILDTGAQGPSQPLHYTLQLTSESNVVLPC